MPAGVQITGVDVARGGAAKTVCAPRVSHVVFSVDRFNLADSVKLAALINSRYLDHQTHMATIDVIGVGAGVVDILRNTPGKNIIAFSAARASKRRDRSGQLGFVNQRATMWWRLREALDPAYNPTLCLPPDDELTGDLTAPRWWVTPGNKIAIESKEDLEKRIGRSTDCGDAVCQSLLFEQEFNHAGPDASPVYDYTERLADTAFAWSGTDLFDE